MKINFTHLKHDINGNARIVCQWNDIPGANSFAEAVKIANAIGGRKYNSKAYGGGIVFQGSESEVLHNLKYLVEKRAAAGLPV